MRTDPTEFGRFAQPYSESLADYVLSVSQAPAKVSKMVLRDNVVALMEFHWGKQNLSQLARDAKIGLGSASRIVDGNTSVGADIVEKVADAFGLPPWALLIPGLDPQNPPKAWLSKTDAEKYERALAAARDLAAH